MTYLLSLLIIVPTLVNALSIDEAVQQTIETNPQIQVKKEELLTEKETLTGAKSDYLPTVDLAYTVGGERTHTIGNKIVDSATNNSADGKEDNLRQEASINLNQNLFAGFDTMYRVEPTRGINIISR